MFLHCVTQYIYTYYMSTHLCIDRQKNNRASSSLNLMELYISIIEKIN